jgi:hypothetical protein
MRTSRFLLLSAAAAVIGWTIFGVMAWQAVTVDEVGTNDAAERLSAVREAFGGTPPLVAYDSSGQLVRRETTPPSNPAPVTHIYVLSYHAANGRLVHADVPFWFFTLKAPAAQFFVRDTGLDLNTLGLTAGDLEREGPTLVLDEGDAGGDLLLVWTE